jgi:hypothetical protein
MIESATSEEKEMLWRFMVFVKLEQASSLNVRELVNAQDDAPISRVAYITRNLLELLIWTEYCGKSVENSRRFYLDSLRDWVDLLRLLPPEEVGVLTGQVTIADILAELKLHEPERPFVKVREAAKEVGRLEFYEAANKILSKLAHPTALSIMLPMSADEEIVLRRKLILAGKDIGIEAIGKRGSFLK